MPELNRSPGGLVVGRCDPYGAEPGPGISLLGGMFPQSQVGRIMWHCSKPAEARYRMICTGGDYGERVGADGGQLPAYHCPGGHRGQPMRLCRDHRISIARRQAGLCPACAFPAEAREVIEAAERCQAAMAAAFARSEYAALAQLQSDCESLTARSTELSTQGIIHRCPLRLIEVS